VQINVKPSDRIGKRPLVGISPPTSYIKVVNRAKTVTKKLRGKKLKVSSIPYGKRNKIIIEGEISLGSEPKIYYRRIDNPPYYFGTVIKETMEQLGFEIKGRVYVGIVPEDSVLIHTFYSPPLHEIVDKLNKFSNNFIAEQLIKAVGAFSSGPPGSWEKGLEVAKKFLQSIGVSEDAFVLRNGSGLGDVNLMSPSQIVKLLLYMYRDFKYGYEFISSLPVSGADGTIKDRFEATSTLRHIRAKTGTLDIANALSGYLISKGDNVYAFCIMINHSPLSGEKTEEFIDRMSSLVVSLALSESKYEPTE
jgi:D-alanyl-D-alanine carboxypeptidase/D-alanyl-D-alanine-endopeptidase (penicillin-binding protein 4)